MKSDHRAKWVAFHRALWGSVALHAVVAGVLLLLFRAGTERAPGQPGIDTRAAQEPQVRISLTDDAPASTDLAPPPSPPARVDPPPSAEQPAAPVGPRAPAEPRRLPPELIAQIGKLSTTASGPEPVEVPIPMGGATIPSAPAQPVRPVGLTGNGAAGRAPALHGALVPGTTVVYILDCSGSMGAAGKLDVARAVLASTLGLQPPTVSFQVIVYAGRATPLLATNGTAVPASAANVRVAVEKLGPLEARGKSNHLDAVRAALVFRPDVIVLLTDADDLSAAALKALQPGAPKPVPVCVGQVTAEGVKHPRELR
jgi:hypothetical protein